METSTTESPLAPESSDWPRDGLERVPNCPACGSSERHIFYEGLTDWVFFCAPGNWSLYQCRGCRSAYLDPRPSLDTIHLAYQTYYTHISPKRRPAEDLKPLRWYMRAQANGYSNHRYGGTLRPSSVLGPLTMRLLPHYRRKVDREFRYLPRASPGFRLLDVGFGSGTFLYLAEQAGWVVSGVDTDPVTVENARRRGLDVRRGGIDAYGDQCGEFDAITMNHVIEHVHYPQEFLRSAYSLLKPGGCLYLETPNIEALGRKEFGKYWRGLEPPRHLTIFSWAALEEMLRVLGFQRIKRYRCTDVYPSISIRSRAIRDGKAPDEYNPSNLEIQLKGLINGMRSRLSVRNTEYITLMTYKPM